MFPQLLSDNNLIAQNTQNTFLLYPTQSLWRTELIKDHRLSPCNSHNPRDDNQRLQAFNNFYPMASTAKFWLQNMKRRNRGPLFLPFPPSYTFWGEKILADTSHHVPSYPTIAFPNTTFDIISQQPFHTPLNQILLVHIGPFSYLLLNSPTKTKK